MNIYKLENDDVFFCGDLHGLFEEINVTIHKYNLNDCSIVFCGDIGIGFEKEEYYRQVFNHLTKTLRRKNIYLYMFRGNHDDKSFFDGNHFKKHKYIHVIPDYSILSTPTRNILCIGGGTSIDRLWRKMNMDSFAIDYMKYHNVDWDTAYQKIKKLYWEDEAIVFDEDILNQIKDSDFKIDTICTHSAPSFCNPTTKDGIKEWMLSDPDLEEDVNQERNTCDLIYQWCIDNNQPLKNWYYGHFHKHVTEIIEGVKFTMLNMSRGILDIV